MLHPLPARRLRDIQHDGVGLKRTLVCFSVLHAAPLTVGNSVPR